MGHGQWISQMFAGSCGMVRLENTDSEPDTGRMQRSGGYTLFVPFIPSFQIVLVLILSFSIQSSLPHFHFHSQSQFLLLRHLILILPS